VEALPAALGISQEEAMLLLQDGPTFLLKVPDALTAAWMELQRAAKEQPEWREQIGGWTAGTLYRCAESFQGFNCCICFFSEACHCACCPH
jgi:hypothetical protein